MTLQEQILDLIECYPVMTSPDGEVEYIDIKAIRRAAAIASVDRGFLIERSNGGYPEWLYVCGEVFNWTRDSLEAIRFSRRVDAEQVAAVIGEDVDLITEHQWGG